MNGSTFIVGTSWNETRVVARVTLTQGHQGHHLKLFPGTYIKHVKFQKDISMRFPVKLKSVGCAETAAAEPDQKQ